MSVTLLLTTIAAQVGSAYFNSKRSKAQSAELAEQQQRLEEKIMLQGIENSREEYAQVCALQREIEQLMQKDRLELIQQNYLNSIELDAYNVSLEHWPLFTPPYVIKGQLIDGLSGANSTDAIPLNCIMTTSMHSKFNQKIFPQLEERLALFCSKHWNSSQPNSIRFYQNAWRDNIVDLGSRIIDLYAHLDDVPTIVISPVVRNGKITFKIHWWGISGNPKDQHTSDAMLYDPELAITITDDISLSEEQIKQIIEELSNKISALISYFADQYYWIFYGYTPVLPLLADDNDYSIKVGWKTNYSSQYKLLYEKEIEGTSTKIATNPQAVIELYSKIKPLIEDELPFPMEATNALYKSKLNIKLWYCTSLKELSLKIKSYSDSNQFYLKKVSNKIALGTYDVSDNATNIFIIICNKTVYAYYRLIEFINDYKEDSDWDLQMRALYYREFKEWFDINNAVNGIMYFYTYATARYSALSMDLNGTFEVWSRDRLAELEIERDIYWSFDWKPFKSNAKTTSPNKFEKTLSYFKTRTNETIVEEMVSDWTEKDYDFARERVDGKTDFDKVAEMLRYYETALTNWREIREQIALMLPKEKQKSYQEITPSRCTHDFTTTW